MSDAKPIFNDLSDHDFIIKAILQDYTPLMKAEYSGVKYADLATHQKYQYETGFRAGQVLNQLERIEQACILVNSYPYVKAWRDHYGQFEYFQYHVEAYYLGVAGLVDRLLLLINQLCRLGIEDKNAKMAPVIKQLKRGQYSRLVAPLETIKMGTEAVKKMRNDVAHAQRFHEKDLWHIAVLEFSLRNKTVDDKEGYLKADLDWDIKFYRQKMRQQLQKSNETLIAMVAQLFDELNAAYNQERVR